MHHQPSRLRSLLLLAGLLLAIGAPLADALLFHHDRAVAAVRMGADGSRTHGDDCQLARELAHSLLAVGSADVRVRADVPTRAGGPSGPAPLVAGPAGDLHSRAPPSRIA